LGGFSFEFLAPPGRPAQPEFLFYHTAQHLSREKSQKIILFIFPKTVDFWGGVWYYNYIR
jgi:hypothetical protein